VQRLTEILQELRKVHETF